LNKIVMRFGMNEVVLISLGAVAGALLRYATHVWLEQPGQLLPLPTLIVNLLGSLLIGWLYGAGWLGSNEQLRLLAAVGFLGSLTTFSAFSLDTLRRIEAGHWGWALGYVLLSVLGGLAAVAGGSLLGRWSRGAF
jgi:CrcB protein